MCLFKVNTGCREQEVCQLRWDWEVQVPELDTSVFIRAGRDREEPRRPAGGVESDRRCPWSRTCGVVTLNYVFTYKGHAVRKINNSSWKRLRKKVGLPLARVHDLKHTFGRRLRAAGVTGGNAQGTARPSQRRHHDPLLRPRTGGTPGGGQPGLRRQVRQNSDTDCAETESGCHA